MVERPTRGGPYKLTKQFNPSGASDSLAMVLLYGALTSDSEVNNHYDALVRKNVSELTENDI